MDRYCNYKNEFPEFLTLLSKFYIYERKLKLCSFHALFRLILDGLAKETKEEKIEGGITNEELFVYGLLSSWRLQIVRHLLQITCPKFDKLISTYGEPNIST